MVVVFDLMNVLSLEAVNVPTKEHRVYASLASPYFGLLPPSMVSMGVWHDWALYQYLMMSEAEGAERQD